MIGYFRVSFIFMLLVAVTCLALALIFLIISFGHPLLVFLIPVILFILFAIGPMILDFI